MSSTTSPRFIFISLLLLYSTMPSPSSTITLADSSRRRAYCLGLWYHTFRLPDLRTVSLPECRANLIKMADREMWCLTKSGNETEM